MSTPSREGREPFNGPLYGLSQLVLFIAMIPNFLPLPARLLAIGFAGWVAYKAIFFQTTGDMGGDLGFGSAVIQQLLIGIDIAIATPPNEFKELSDKNPTPITERTLKERAVWAIKLFVNPRGLGWAHEPLHLPSRPSPSTSRLAFVIRGVSLMVGCIVLEGLLYVVNASNPGLTTPGLLVSQAPFLWWVLGVGGFIVSGVCRLTALHSGLGALVVGCGFSSPARWPNLFGWPLEAWSVQRLWRRVWHQNVRKSATGCASLITRILPRPTSTLGVRLHKLSRVYVTFFFIAVAHMGGERILTGITTLSTFKLFMLQPVGITAELLVVYIWRRLTRSEVQHPRANGKIETNGGAHGSVGSKFNGVTNVHTREASKVVMGGHGNVGLEGRIDSVREPPALWIRLVGMAWVIYWGIFTAAYMVDPMCTVGMFTDPRVDLRKYDWGNIVKNLVEL